MKKKSIIIVSSYFQDLFLLEILHVYTNSIKPDKNHHKASLEIKIELHINLFHLKSSMAVVVKAIPTRI